MAPRLILGRISTSYVLAAILFVICILIPSRRNFEAIDRHESLLHPSYLSKDQPIASEPDVLPRVPPGEVTFEKRRDLGRLVKCLMDAENDAAAREMITNSIKPGLPFTSPFTETAELVANGYTLRGFPLNPEYESAKRLDKAFTFLGIRKDWNYFVPLLHTCRDDNNNIRRIINKEGQVVLPTLAHFDNVFNPKDGVIIADNNRSPSNVRPKPATLPDIKNWSDVAFLLWIHQTKDLDKRNLKYCFRAHVVAADTIHWIAEVMKWKELSEFPTWEKRVTLRFDAATSEELDWFHVILGTTNGVGCALLLAQHKPQLGVKTIDTVVIWALAEGKTLDARPGPAGVSMYFTVEDVVGIDPMEGVE